MTRLYPHPVFDGTDPSCLPDVVWVGTAHLHTKTRRAPLWALGSLHSGVVELCGQNPSKPNSARKRRSAGTRRSGASCWYPQRGGYGPAPYRSISTTPGANRFIFISYKVNHSNGSRFLPVDAQAMLLLSVIFMRLMVETTCDE
ncbi:hypothetical protein BBIA_3002 [Bifidobacterium biavatii DSM 23969]|uniref:Uncharacterized protein n=1 Tax=Bifidobacterium biavatii DSM 23969 TaxID=1437608 RepID=A0A086ZXH0_9BIFI|nr:hypothetical protein BBIA_3002 [Bifidobacterium biavatii DSM 23969]